MNPGASTLNPYAQAYVPLAKREVKNEDQDHKNLSNEANVYDGCPASGDLKLKYAQVDDPLGGPSQKPYEMENKFTDEESEMDLAYLQMMFPTVSDQSLVDVYTVNGGDLEAAVDMLNHLESADNLPDALDIGDVHEPLPPGECSSSNVKNITRESSGSSGPSDLSVAT